jgi:hypothetical protein
MRLSALLLIVAAMIYALPVEAQKTPTSIQLLSCHRLCVQGGEKCSGEAGSTAPYCDTLEIGCVVACDACIDGFDKCTKSEEQSPRFCQNLFSECLEKKLTASRSRARPQIAFKGGDGLSQKTAVVIEGAQSESEGILAESLWISRQHADWRKRDRSLVTLDGKNFDSIDYRAADGAHTIWFDITGFFGK